MKKWFAQSKMYNTSLHNNKIYSHELLLFRNKFSIIPDIFHSKHLIFTSTVCTMQSHEIIHFLFVYWTYYSYYNNLFKIRNFILPDICKKEQWRMMNKVNWTILILTMMVVSLNPWFDVPNSQQPFVNHN